VVPVLWGQVRATKRSGYTRRRRLDRYEGAVRMVKARPRPCLLVSGMAQRCHEKTTEHERYLIATIGRYQATSRDYGCGTPE
jgi:hypothetical protein